MKRRSSRLAAAALIFLCGPAPAQSNVEPVSVWIVPFDVLGDEVSRDEPGVTLADLLTVALSRWPEYAVVDRRVLAEVLAERSETGGAPGQLVWARWMLHGTVTRRGDALGITAHVTDVASTRILGSARVSGAADTLPRMVQALTAELRAVLQGAARPAGAGEADAAPAANLHFMRGLSRFHAGQYHRALAEFIRSGAEPEVEQLSSLWRANCYLATKRYDHAFLELSRLRREGPGRVKSDDLQRLLEECLQHLSPGEVRTYREL